MKLLTHPKFCYLDGAPINIHHVKKKHVINYDGQTGKENARYDEYDEWRCSGCDKRYGRTLTDFGLLLVIIAAIGVVSLLIFMVITTPRQPNSNYDTGYIMRRSFYTRVGLFFVPMSTVNGLHQQYHKYVCPIEKHLLGAVNA